MAKQHFYSRVPAKMSYFNKMDSYDTFAYSKGIARGTIEKELSAVYANAPTKDDIALIQKNGLPTVYAQFKTENDETVQSAVSFIKSDYTGERSSYMVHSLILSQDERNATLYSSDNSSLNPENFMKDLSEFDLVSPSSKPNNDYPEKNIVTVKAKSTSDIVKKYDAGMLKRFIYALIGIPCGKTKSLFLSLSSPIASFSEDCLEFLNTVLQIFPYQLRDSMSFVTYSGDCSKYSSFKIKCVPDSMPEIPTVKGITIKMEAKDYKGIDDNLIVQNKDVVDFFFGLLTADNIRRSFIEYYQNAVKMDESLKKVNLKTLTDLVLIFRALSGYFNDSDVIFDDEDVYNYVCVYDKLRNCLSDDFKNKALNCIWRYPKNETAIPKNIFAKVSGFYDRETDESKKNFMKMVIDLIHTDAMREKLFSFISANFSDEDAETKSIICESLCRVYYGGFLQKQILCFFSECFTEGTEATRKEILEKLLLTVRTPAVQDDVLEFVRKHYNYFTDAEKDMFFDTYFEMLPVGDELTARLSGIVDEIIDDGRKNTVEKNIVSAIISDTESGETAVCSAISNKCGFCESVVAKTVFTSLKDNDALDAFLACLNKKSIKDRANTVKEIFESVDSIDYETTEKLKKSIQSGFEKGGKYLLFNLLEALDTLEGVKESASKSKEFIEFLEDNCIKPEILKSISMAFDAKRYPDGIDNIVKYAERYNFIFSSQEYKSVISHISAVKALESSDLGLAISHLSKLVSTPVNLGSAELISKKFGEGDTDTSAMCNLACNYLKSGEFLFCDCGNGMRDKVISELKDQGNENLPEITAAADETVINKMIDFAYSIYCADIDEETREKLISSNGEFRKFILIFINKYEKKGKKILDAKLTASSYDFQFADAVREMKQAKSSGGFFKKLFK